MKIPVATYRLQFNKHFTLKHAINLIDYFQQLGVSHCYCSPLLRAKKGTTHGYDLVNPLEINPEIGTKEEFIEFAKKLKEAGMGLILDIVPNHMYIGDEENAWWQDVLQKGPSSSFAKYFDIDWNNDKVVLPKKHKNQKDQTYVRYVDWHSPEINYRRFFDILDYAGVRIEEPEVYKKFHELIVELQEHIDGLRIDHIDGLYDPLQYLLRLKKDFPKYLVVEKVLLGKETLPQEWPVQGTVGYDFLNQANGLFVYKPHKQQFLDLYHEFTKASIDLKNIVLNCKKLVLNNYFGGELHRLTKKIDYESRIKIAIANILINYSVYRTYINSSRITDQDRKRLELAITDAKKSGDASAIEFIGKLFPSILDFVMPFQQVTGPIMAKGLEDTACYRFFPLASLNEVGSDLETFGLNLEDFQRQYQHSLLASSTHDTKRSEDVRARINVLSEMPEEWRKKIWKWRKINGLAPDQNEEYLLYQTLVGTWPDKISKKYVRRIQEYMLKAINEGKVNSCWLEPNKEYLDSFANFVEDIFGNETFVQDISQFVSSINTFGHLNSLAETLIRLTYPGVPDIYQGCEIWNYTLVDPDNRHPIDFELRKKLLSVHPKISLIKTVLHFRKQVHQLFTYGDYLPLIAKGSLSNHVIAFARTYENKTAITITGRFFYLLKNKSWEDTSLELPFEGPFIDIFTGNRYESHIPLVELLGRQPLSLLIN